MITDAGHYGLTVEHGGSRAAGPDLDVVLTVKIAPHLREALARFTAAAEGLATAETLGDLMDAAAKMRVATESLPLWAVKRLRGAALVGSVTVEVK